MVLLTAEEIEAFVAPFYASKDTMHDLTHIRWVRRKAEALAESYVGPVDRELLLAGIYFHGIVYDRQDDVVAFLREKGITPDRVERILTVARESQKEEVPATLEGTILHDAHLTEGGASFLIVKCIATGSARGQTLAQTIDYTERNVLGKFRCYLPEAQPDYAAKLSYAREFLNELKADLEE